MEVLGIGLTQDNMQRIVGAVGAMALALLSGSDCKRDIEEAIELHKLHGRLIKAMDKFAAISGDVTDGN